MGKRIHIITFIIYTILASIVSKIIDIHWLHVLNALILSSILYHLLEWKYDWEEEEGE